MGLSNGVHHLAVATADIKKQIEFCSDVLGMELVALYWMHGVDNTFHGFLRLNDESAIAFVQNPDIGDVPVQLGQTHAGNPGANSARRTTSSRSMRSPRALRPSMIRPNAISASGHPNESAKCSAEK